jgi:hypothetical protein
MWAGFLREHFKLHKGGQPSPELVAEALALAHGREASYLPGWSGIAA